MSIKGRGKWLSTPKPMKSPAAPQIERETQETIIMERVDGLDDREERDDEPVFRLFGKEILNVEPLVGLAFFITLLVLIIEVVALWTRPDLSSTIIPLLVATTSLWVPSPGSKGVKGNLGGVTTMSMRNRCPCLRSPRPTPPSEERSRPLIDDPNVILRA